MAARVAVMARKPRRRAAMEPLRKAPMRSRTGLDDDANADPLSPRQVLLASVDALRRLDVPPGSLRENVLVEGLNVEALRAGTEVLVGDARLRVSFPCDPCEYLRSDAGVPPADAEGLRGTLATVVSGGAPRVGDTVRVVDGSVRGPAFPSRKNDRLLWLVCQIPRGRVSTYGDLARAAGLPRQAARSLPTKLKALGDDAPIHRVVPVDPKALTASQVSALRSEGTDGRPKNRWLWVDVLYGGR